MAEICEQVERQVFQALVGFFFNARKTARASINPRAMEPALDIVSTNFLKASFRELFMSFSNVLYALMPGTKGKIPDRE